jgi:hypothetical protein
MKCFGRQHIAHMQFEFAPQQAQGQPQIPQYLHPASSRTRKSSITLKQFTFLLKSTESFTFICIPLIIAKLTF